MATKRFFFWRGYHDMLCRLQPLDRAEMISAMGAYAFDGIDPDFGENVVLDTMWPVIRDQISESVEIGERMSDMGKKSGAARRKNEPSSNDVQTQFKPRSNVRKGKELKGTSFPFGKGDASRPRAVEARALASDDDDDSKWVGDTL